MNPEQYAKDQLSYTYDRIAADQETRSKIKNWCVTVWVGSLAVVGSGRLTHLAGIQTVLPFLPIMFFWMLDGRVPHSSRFCLSGSFLSSRPPRSNFNHSFFSRDIVTITAPGPVFRSLDEASCDRITVDVFQLLCAFGATPDIEVVIAWLPEVFALVAHISRGLHLPAFGKCGAFARVGRVGRWPGQNGCPVFKPA